MKPRFGVAISPLPTCVHHELSFLSLYFIKDDGDDPSPRQKPECASKGREISLTIGLFIFTSLVYIYSGGSRFRPERNEFANADLLFVIIVFIWVV